MRAFIAVASLAAVLAACAALAPGQSAPPAPVGPLGIYQCPDHPEIQATWQARCPTCGTPLQAVQLFDAAARTVFAADANYFAPPQAQPQNPPYYPPPTGSYGNQGYNPYPPGQYGYNTRWD